MANIANNTYKFYGDRTELVKCHEKLSKMYEENGSYYSCVNGTEHDIIHPEWIEYVEELSEDSTSFEIDTSSKWYGNPLYWNNWVEDNFPKLSVAFMCEECGMGIFEKVDPDNKFDDYIWIHGSSVPEEDVTKLPQVIKDAMCEESVWGTFCRDEVFNSEFQPSDLPESIECREYFNTTYEEINESYNNYRAMLDDPKEQLNNVEATRTTLFTLDNTGKN